MTGPELDIEVRKVFNEVTRETILEGTRRLTDLGFSPSQAFELLIRVIEERE